MFVWTAAAGHGGRDRRGCVRPGIVEAEYTLAVVLAMQKHFDGLGFRCVLARDDDSRVSLFDRGRLAAGCGAAFGLAVHVNACQSMSVHGTDIFYRHGCGTSEELAPLFADCMPAQLRTGRTWDAHDLPGHDKTDWLARPERVLGPYGCPAILVELGYASNTRDLAYLLEPWTIEELACRLAAAVIKARHILEPSCQT